MSSANPPQIKLDHFVSVLGFAASGDMQKFAFSKYEPPEGHALYVVNREGKNRVRLVVNKHSMFLPEFSPDGKWIAYLIPDQDVDNVSVVKSDEPGPPRTVTVPHLFGGVGNSISWIDSQNFVVFNGEMKTFVCSVLGGEPKQLFFEDSTWAEPILGGKYMVYQDFRKGREGRWIAPVDPQGKLSGKPTRFLSAVTAFRSPDSRIWIYEKHPGEVWRITLPGGKEERWGKLPPLLKLRQFMRVILSDDGKRLAYMTHGVTLKLVLLENVFE
jgi:dipeptidyl aminopeptidase/acylaminoacyl peptidase